jgi:hypothetical protein
MAAHTMTVGAAVKANRLVAHLSRQTRSILTGRANSERTRLASCAVGLLVAHARVAGGNPTGKA